MMQDPNTERMIQDAVEPLKKQIQEMQIEIEKLKLRQEGWSNEDMRTLWEYATHFPQLSFKDWLTNYKQQRKEQEEKHCEQKVQ